MGCVARVRPAGWRPRLARLGCVAALLATATAAEPERPHVVIVMSEQEYETEKTLPAFAKRHLEGSFRVSLVFGDEQDGNELPGLEVLKEADVLLLSARRRALRPEQMKIVRDFIEAGRPVVGIRTASHAFSLRGKEPPQGRVVWDSFDADVFGGNYTNHYGEGPETRVGVAEGANGHSILTGVDAEEWSSAGSLYKVSPLADSATALLVGTIADVGTEPVAWTNETKFGGKAFYTSLGHKGDFETEGFRRLLFNAVCWTAGREVPATMPDAGSRLSPSDFTVPDDLEWELVLSEPAVRQPVYLDFDEKGRLWVAQYLQYPEPAGLTMLSKDKYWRAVYDAVPSPPPGHVRGADKITIHEDADGDGTFESQKTFIEGLSLVTSFARGRGGVWVLNPPYLLFYADRNDDDVPDGAPEVHLAGFGLEDTHAVANSLRFGPDGWLYACLGSTVSGHVVRPGTDDKPVNTMGQLVWRYHPQTRAYEVFAEGGGNAFGLEVDAKGNIYSGYNGGDTRGFHYVQGGYYRKGFEKHGPLSNPHTYGYFEPMKHPPVERFTHDFVIYEGDALPEAYRGKLFGVEPLQGQVTLTEIAPNGSTFETRDLDRSVRSAEGGRFRPVHITTGPDGAIYVADFHEEYIAHLDHFAGRIMKETGRVYRLRARGAATVTRKEERRPAPLTPGPSPQGEGDRKGGGGAGDLSKLSTEELVEVLDHPNRWQRQTALRVLADRGDEGVVERLREELAASGGRQPPENLREGVDEDAREADASRSPLERVWALHQLGALDEGTTLEALDHADPHVRAWAVRLACDDGEVVSSVADRLIALAVSEPDVRVRVQLACSARRLAVDRCLAIVGGLLGHGDDANDPFLPLSVWWAVEAKCGSDPEAVVAFFSGDEVWSKALARDVLAERVVRRFASGGRADLARCATLLKSAADDDVRTRMLAGFEAAFRGRSASALPDELAAELARAGELPLSLRIRRGEGEAIVEAIKRLGDGSVGIEERVDLASLLGESRPAEALPVLLGLFDSAEDEALRSAALGALAGYRDDAIVDRLLAALPNRESSEQVAILSVLVSRADWSSKLVEKVQSGVVAKEDVPVDLARRLTVHADERLTAMAEVLWPEIASRQERSQSDVAALQAVVVAGSADRYRGKRLYMESCGRCHRLFGEGGDVGPDLTADPRNDLSRLLGAVVTPSAEIREGFEGYVAVTADGRVVSGLLIDQDEHIVVLRESDGRAVTLRREELEEFVRQAKSLMPDGLLDRMTDQEVRDLFTYVRSSQPLNE